MGRYKFIDMPLSVCCTTSHELSNLRTFVQVEIKTVCNRYSLQSMIVTLIFTVSFQYL